MTKPAPTPAAGAWGDNMPTGHPLAPLLTPRSIAFIGASPRLDTPGNDMIRNIQTSDYAGAVYPVNPKYEEVEGLACYPSLAALPEPVDLAVLAVASHRLEAQLAEAISNRARSAVIFANCYLENDTNPPLVERLARLAREAGMPVCGGNCMGYYNLEAGLRICGFPSPKDLEPGPITFITHSGSTFAALVHHDRRFAYNLVVSSGQELATTAADYMDFALEMETTRVIGLFIESVRDPDRFIAALKKARVRDVPIVALKVGRTEESAALALSHSGAMAGNDAAYEAVFDRYGVIRVDTLDDLAATLLVFAQPRRPSPGRLAVILDSGGEREMLIDLAEDAGVPLAKISRATREKLAARLDPSLEPINPLDAWDTGRDFQGVFTDCFAALMDDPDTALGVLLAELKTSRHLSEGFAKAVEEVFRGTEKPVFYASNFNVLGTGRDAITLRLTKTGIPTLNGTMPALHAVRNMLDYRDFRARPEPSRPPDVPAEVRARWHARLSHARALDESEALALLADYAIPVLANRVVDSREAAVQAACEVGFPVALKTAAPGVHHKSDVGGIALDLADRAAVTAAYDDLADRLGPRVLVMAMAEKGVELAFGVVADAQFGPIILVGAGGVLVELLRDRRFALPPFDATTARRLIDGLKVRPLLDGKRGAAPADIDAVAETLSRLSVMAADLGDRLKEVDVNPCIATPKGCFAVDALIVSQAPPADERRGTAA